MAFIEKASRGYSYNWPEIEKKAGRTLEDLYEEYRSTRKMGKFLGPVVGIKSGISYFSIAAELRRRGHVLKRGGKNNTLTKADKQRDAGKRRCQVCNKVLTADRYFYCNLHQPDSDWIQEAGVNW